jgi:hypothetical protein
MGRVGGLDGLGFSSLSVTFHPCYIASPAHHLKQEGMFTFLFGLLAFLVLPNSPATARFFSTKERNYVMAKLKADGAVAGDDKSDGFKWIEVIRCCQSIHVWLLAPVLFFLGKYVFLERGVLK